MVYTPTAWVDNTTPAIDAANLNHIEAGIVAATERQPGYTSPNPTPFFNAKDYGVAADGTTDDTAALQAAMTASAGVGRLELPAGTIKAAGALTFPDYLDMHGQGRGKTIIQRAFTGDFVTAMGVNVKLESLTIDGVTATYGAGRGVLVAAAKHSQWFRNMEIVNFATSCLEFAADAGSGFTAIGSYFVTAGAVGTVGAVKVNGTDSAAVPRFFFGCSGVGCTLFDFGGANDFFVLGGYSTGLIFGSASSKVCMSSVRLAAVATYTISGNSHHIVGTVFGGALVLDSTTLDCVLDANQVPSYNVTDNGAGNWVSFLNQAYTPTWTGASANPTLGDGTLTGEWSRQGDKISVDVTLTIGSTTTLGTGAWSFSMPVAPYAFGSYKVGPAWLYNGSGGATTIGVANLNPALSAAFLWANGSASNVGPAAPFSWVAGSQLQFHIEYQCA